MVGRPTEYEVLVNTAAPPSVSVALCTHNGADYLDLQIASICQQTWLADEIVLSDDASGDATVEIAKSAVERYAVNEMPRLRVMRNAPALGITANFEQAVRACSGDLIVLCDQDDIWLPDRLEFALQEFRRRPDLLLLHSNAQLIDAAGQTIGRGLFHALEVQPYEITWLHEGHAFEVFLRRNLVTGATAVFRRELLGSALPFPSAWLHDEWLAAVASTIGRVDVLEQQLIAYRQHGRNAIGARRLTVGEMVQRALAPRGKTHFERAEKAAIWLDRLDELAASGALVDAKKRQALVDRLMHQRFRAALPERRLQRIKPIWKELKTGNYNRFGRGARGVVRDMLEAP